MKQYPLELHVVARNAHRLLVRGEEEVEVLFSFHIPVAVRVGEAVMVLKAEEREFRTMNTHIHKFMEGLPEKARKPIMYGVEEVVSTALRIVHKYSQKSA